MLIVGSLRVGVCRGKTFAARRGEIPVQDAFKLR
jgi:hypothetical protein